MFCPGLPAEKVEAITRLGYGHVNKIFLEYARPFWVWREGGIKLAWSAEELMERDGWVKGRHSLIVKLAALYANNILNKHQTHS
jgi:monoamine oxidase